MSVDRMVMTESQAGEELGVSPRTLQRWRVEGRGPAFRKLGKIVGYTREDLREFLDRSRRTSTSTSAA